MLSFRMWFSLFSFAGKIPFHLTTADIHFFFLLPISAFTLSQNKSSACSIMVKMKGNSQVVWWYKRWRLLKLNGMFCIEFSSSGKWMWVKWEKFKSIAWRESRQKAREAHGILSMHSHRDINRFNNKLFPICASKHTKWNSIHSNAYAYLRICNSTSSTIDFHALVFMSLCFVILYALSMKERELKARISWKNMQFALSKQISHSEISLNIKCSIIA